MHLKKFAHQLSHDAVVDAIRQAEVKTTGQIRVFISHRKTEDAVADAQKEFAHLGLGGSPEKNSVLIFVSPRSHKFAVIGDEGVHARCGDAFWQELARAMSEYFRKSQFKEGLIHGVERAGQLLAEHFPRVK